MTDSRYSVLDTMYTIVQVLINHNITPQPSRCIYYTLHLNINNSTSKFDNLKYIIQELKDININLQFIIICDTFLVESNAGLFQIPGYKCIHNG